MSDSETKEINTYYENEKCKLYQGDCLEVMKNIPDKSVDMISINPCG
jgi:DNA modification methylase